MLQIVYYIIFLVIVIFFFHFRKSVKSLFFLLPLLGITNVLHFVWPNPLRGSWLSFAIWSITTHFLYSFQGLFVASVYFLFDDKVRFILIQLWHGRKCHYWLSLVQDWVIQEKKVAKSRNRS